MNGILPKFFHISNFNETLTWPESFLWREAKDDLNMTGLQDTNYVLKKYFDWSCIY